MALAPRSKVGGLYVYVCSDVGWIYLSSFHPSPRLIQRYTMLCYVIPYWGNVGAVFGNMPHIVQVDDFSDLFAFRLIEGPSYILAFKNQDRPGAISEVQASTLCCGATVTTTYQEQCFYY